MDLSRTSDPASPICLITGGAGFLGSAVGRLLGSRGWRVRILDSRMPGGGYHPLNVAGIPNLEVMEVGDVRDEARLAALLPGCSAVFHAAGRTSHADSMSDPRGDLSANVEGTAAVLEAVRRAAPEAAVVFAGTRQVYGTPRFLPVSEDHPIDPPDVNAVGKRAAEDLGFLYHRIHGLRWTVLRFTNIYGPGLRVRDARQMFLGIWLRRALEGGDLAIFGDGTQRRDLLYVDDAAAAVLAAFAPHAAGQVFNVGRPDPVSLQDLAEQLVALAGQGRLARQPFPPDRKGIDIGDYASATGRIEAALGWKPAVPLRAGLALTLDYYREHLAAYVENAQ